MAPFAFQPPLRLRIDPDHPVATLDDAAAIVRRYAKDHADGAAESLLHRLEGAFTPEDDEQAALAFRGWAEQQGLLLLPGKRR